MNFKKTFSFYLDHRINYKNKKWSKCAFETILLSRTLDSQIENNKGSKYKQKNRKKTKEAKKEKKKENEQEWWWKLPNSSMRTSRFVSHLCELLSVYHGGNLMHSPSISRVNKIQLKTRWQNLLNVWMWHLSISFFEQCWGPSLLTAKAICRKTSSGTLPSGVAYTFL